MEQLQLPVYASCVSKEEPRMETILEIYNRIVGEELRPTTEEYRRVMRKGDPEVTARMKRTAFPALMPACVCAGFRRKECVTRYTGLCQVDFDKVPAERTHEVALRLKALPETLLLYRSMGNGLHLLYRYEGDYRQAFPAGQPIFRRAGVAPLRPVVRADRASQLVMPRPGGLSQPLGNGFRTRRAWRTSRAGADYLRHLSRDRGELRRDDTLDLRRDLPPRTGAGGATDAIHAGATA